MVNLIHRDDCIHIIRKIIEQNVWSEDFNCCADSHPTKQEFYSKVMFEQNLSLPKFERSNPKKFKLISNQKVKELLDYQFIHPDLMKIDFS